MAKTTIEWCHYTFNTHWGCTKVSPECDSCYAEAGAIRYGWSDSGKHFPIWGKDAQRRFFGDKHWEQPDKWNHAALVARERHRVFCASYGDVLEDRPDLAEPRARLVRKIEYCEALDWLLLTKRPQNFQRLFPWRDTYPPNVWAMTTVGCKSSLWRIDALREVPAVVRGLSVEPLLEDLGTVNLDDIHWVIVGGESGPGARPMHASWVRNLRNQCSSAGVAFFFKQWGAWQDGSNENWDGKVLLNDGRMFPESLEGVDAETRNNFQQFEPRMVSRVGKKAAGRMFHGREWNEFPDARRGM